MHKKSLARINSQGLKLLSHPYLRLTCTCVGARLPGSVFGTIDFVSILPFKGTHHGFSVLGGKIVCFDFYLEQFAGLAQFAEALSESLNFYFVDLTGFESDIDGSV